MAKVGSEDVVLCGSVVLVQQNSVNNFCGFCYRSKNIRVSKLDAKMADVLCLRNTSQNTV